jgi:hypothetical protein
MYESVRAKWLCESVSLRLDNSVQSAGLSLSTQTLLR